MPHFKIIFLFIINTLLATVGFGQESPTRDRQTSSKISKSRFDAIIDSSINWLQTKKLAELSDSDHINIMMCLNTIQMTADSNFDRLFIGGRYKKFNQTVDAVNYTREIKKMYTQFYPNRGMGYYFPKLDMELGGTPSLYTYFKVEE